MVVHRDASYAYVKSAQEQLRQAEVAFAENTLFYDAKLAMLRSAPGPIDVKMFKHEKAGVPLDTPDSAIGKPVLDVPVPEIKNSLKVNEEELAKMRNERLKASMVLKELIDDTAVQTRKLNGLDEMGNKVKPSLFELREEEEAELQRRTSDEYEYLLPLSVDAMKNADIYRDRYLRLLKDLERVKKSAPEVTSLDIMIAAGHTPPLIFRI